MTRERRAAVAGWSILVSWPLVTAWVLANCISCVSGTASAMKGKVDLTTGEVELRTTEVVVVENITGTAITRHEINTEDTPMGVLGWVTLGLGVIGAANLVSPKGLKNLWTLFRPGSEWPDTWKAGGALLGVTDSPKPAPQNVSMAKVGFHQED